MVSISNEVVANVWTPESLISKVHIGKLVGHKYAISEGQFLKHAPFFATIDSSNCINVWDMKTTMCIQTIVGQLSNFKCEGMLVVSNL